MSLVTGTKLGRYEIRTQLGAGGMGEVYLAQDTKLDRKVALKILPADVGTNRDRMERFIREAKSAAALNHPHIAHIYEIGESDGTHFIAMEFIEAVSLPGGQYNDPRFSPDGSRVALLQGSSGGGDVWVYDFGRATFTRLT